MKILLLNQTFYPDNAATSQYLTDLALELANQGFSVDVISDGRSYDNRHVVLPRYEVHKGVRIHRINSTAFGKKTQFYRGLDYLSFSLSFILKLLTLPEYDIVIGLTTPPWISFFGVLFAKLKSGKFIHWAMDVNPDEAVKLGWVKENSLFYKLLNIWARFTYKKSKKIIALDKYMAQLIHSKGIESHKIRIIPLWSHDEIVSVRHKENPFRKKCSLDNKFVIMYSGNFSICHPINTILEAAKALKNQKEIVFIFIGGGVRLNEILAFKEKHNLENVKYLPYQKREEIKYSLSAADLHIISMGEPYVGIVHPCKIYGILSTGRPFILVGPIKSHIGDIITQHNIGYQVNQRDVDGLLKVIQEVRHLTDEQKGEMHNISIGLAKNCYAHQILTATFINCITDSCKHS
jgi:glycosyltransferase involved in cell wall biosynthesis